MCPTLMKHPALDGSFFMFGSDTRVRGRLSVRCFMGLGTYVVKNSLVHVSGDSETFV